MSQLRLMVISYKSPPPESRYLLGGLDRLCNMDSVPDVSSQEPWLGLGLTGHWPYRWCGSPATSETWKDFGFLRREEFTQIYRYWSKIFWRKCLGLGFDLLDSQKIIEDLQIWYKIFNEKSTWKLIFHPS